MNAICPDESEFTLGPIQENIPFVFATILTLPSLRFDTMYVDNYDTFNIYGAEME